jgi:PKD repeat protein
MRKKIEGIVICITLLITSVLTTLIIPENLRVQAGEVIEPEYEPALDLDYIWTQLGNISNVIYNAYDSTDIPKGRSFGSKGGIYTVKLLKDQMTNISNLKNITAEQLQTIDDEHNNYSSIINVSDFSLTVNTIYGPTYPYENPLPKKEMFPIAIKTFRTDLWTHYYSFTDVEIKPMNLTKILPVWGDFESTIQILVFEFLNDNYLPLLGNVSYIPENGSIPSQEEQFLQVFLLDDVNGVQEKLDNITNAAGVIIIDSGNPRIANASNCSCPVVLIYSDNGDSVKNLLENYIVFVDNVRSLSRKLTFTYDPNCYEREPYFVIDRIPDYNEFLNLNVFNNLFYYIILNSYKIPVLKHLIAKLYPGFQTYLTCLQLKLYGLWFHPQCRGVILYDSDDYHFMWSMNTQSKKSSSVWFVKPTICVNNSVGKFLRDNCENKTLTGYITQEYLEEKQEAPGAIGENIYGNISIDKSPSDMIAIISNRYDGMFGTTSGDSAVGTAIVLGIAKFFKDHPSVKPKYNLTFLFTTAEEYGFHGARYHCDKHIDQKQKVKYWLMLDQLGFKQEDCQLCIDYNDTSNNSYFDKILDQIREDSGYPEDKTIKRTGEEISSGSEQATIDKRFTGTTTIGLVKDQDRRWDQWHRTGNNYTEGDSIKNIDREDVNATARLSLGLVKYFMINPDCWFTGFVTYTTVDSPNDSDVMNDSINATFTVKSSLPVDKVRVRAMMKTEYNITRFWKDFDFNATSEGTQKTITVTLPPTFLLPAKYHLYLQLYNSTERINETVVEDSGKCNDTDLQTTNLTKIIYPRGNTNANKPNDIQGPDTLQVLETGDFNSSATDPNNDQLQFHWDWGIDTDRVGPYPSDTPCSKNHTYILRGWKAIQVKVREDYKGQLYDGGLSDLYRYGSWSPWSDPFYIYIDPLIDFDMFCTAAASAQSATQSTVLSSIQKTDSIYEGFAFGGTTPYTYTWYFEYHIGPPPCNQTVTYNYNQTGIKSVTLNVTDHDDYSEEITANITVINLSASYNMSLPSLYTRPGKNITFDDTSAVIRNRSIKNWTWDFGDDTVSYERNPCHIYYCPGEYNVTLTVTDDKRENATYVKTIIIDYDDTPPVINSVFSSLGEIRYGCNVSIVADVSDHISGVKTVSVNITKPDNTTENLTMMYVINDYYYSSFNDTTQPGVYQYSIYVVDYANNTNWASDIGEFTIDFDDPQITNVSASPHTVGFGYNVTITANVTDWESGVDTVNVNITYPDDTQRNYTISYTSGNTYQYIFTDTWLIGQYNYTIWAMDNSSNINSSSGHHFHVSAQATMSIATLRNTYTGNQYINITDPPNPPENYMLVDRGLTWNMYYDPSSGENILETYQGPTNYQEENNTWMPINNTINPLTSNHPAYVYGYRSGNNHGLYGAYFKVNAQNEWPVAFTYNRSDDPTVYTVRSKLVGIGYVDPQSNWAYQYLQNVQNSQGQTNNYSITYSGVFTGANVTWSYGNTGLKEEITLSNATKIVLQNHPPSQYGLNDASSYLVFITKLDYQNLNLYNNSGMLSENITISDVGVEFRDLLGQFKCALPLGEAYELNNESIREKLIYRIIHLNGNTYLLSGLKIADLNAMTFPVVIDPTLTVYSLSSDGYIYNSGSSYSTVQSASTGTVDGSSSYISIGQKKVALGPTYFVYRGFVFFNTSALPSNAYLDNATLSLYKKDDYSTTDFDITIQNGQPTYPHNPMQTGDYFRNYYSGNGGSLGTSRFTSGYNALIMNNLSWINKTGITKLCLRSSRDISGTAPTGNEYVNVYSNEFLGMNPPRLVINYRNQSKIKNTGSTNITGYLLIQVQFYNTTQGKWLVDDDTINETTPRTITYGNQLALDTIFNGLVRASDLTHGTGTYRVYTAFRDPEGNILRTDDGVELKAWWQFNKT